MNPARIWARNFRTYPSLDWTPQNGLTTIIGRNQLGDGADSNGAGKSTLLEALFLALFGPQLPWGEYLTVGGEETTCEVGMEFAHAGETYRVRRTFDAKGRGKSAFDLERYATDGDPLDLTGHWEPLTMGSQADTQALLGQLVGLSEATFVHSVYAPQGHRHFADPSLPPRERKDILADALGLDVWEKLKALVSEDIRGLDRELADVAAKLGAFEDDLARKPELEAAHGVYVAAFAAAARQTAEAEVAEKTARAKHEEARADSERYRTLAAQHDLAKARLETLDKQAATAADARDAASKARAAIEQHTPLAAEVASLEQEVRRIANHDLERAGLIDKHASLEREMHVLEQQIANAASEAETARADAAAASERGTSLACVTCGQALHGDALKTAKASVEKEAARFEAKAATHADQARALTADLAKLRSERDDIRVPAEIPAEASMAAHERLQAAREAAHEITTLTARCEAFDLAIAAGTADAFASEHAAATKVLTEARKALTALTAPDAEALALLGREVERAATDVLTGRAADRTAQTELATSEERLRSLASLAVRAQESLAARERLTGRLNVLKALERSYGRDGIPALRLEVQAIPQIEAEARRVLEALGMPFRVELATQRENKGGGLRDTLDVVVHEPGGARSYATYSGGERTRLEVALRLGIARLIAQRSSSACSMFALDELPWLDRSGQAALVEVLRGLTEFEKVVVVSHEEGLADAFDQAVIVTRDEEGSRIEAAA